MMYAFKKGERKKSQKNPLVLNQFWISCLVVVEVLIQLILSLSEMMHHITGMLFTR
jgi:hypothetical protein